jgi:hypothetical protein
MAALGAQYPRFGYRRIRIFLDREGQTRVASTNHRGKQEMIVEWLGQRNVPEKFFRSEESKLWIFCLVPLFTVAFLYQFQPFFMDENAALSNVAAFLEKRTLIPPHAAYPPLFFYLAALATAAWLTISHLFFGGDSLEGYAIFLRAISPEKFLVGARLLSFFFLLVSCVSLAIVFARRFSRPAVFICIALLLSGRPLMQYSGWALPDVLVLAATTATLLALPYELIDAKGSVSGRSWFLASFFAGIALSAKYNGAVAALLVGFSICDAALTTRNLRILGYGVPALFIIVTTFFLSSLAWVLSPTHMLSGVLVEMKMAEYGHLGITGTPLIGQLELLFSASPPLFILAAFGAAYANRKNSLDRYALYLFVLSLLLPSLNSKQMPQYLFPAYPSLCYFAARAIDRLKQRRNVSTFLSAVALIYFLAVNSPARHYLAKDTLTMGREWLDGEVKPEDSIAVDWAYVPKITTKEDLLLLRTTRSYANSYLLRQHAMREHLFSREDVSYTREWLDNTPARYFVTSNLAFDRFFDHGMFTSTPPQAGTKLSQDFSRSKEFYLYLQMSPRWQLLKKITSGDGNELYFYRNMSDR